MDEKTTKEGDGRGGHNVPIRPIRALCQLYLETCKSYVVKNLDSNTLSQYGIISANHGTIQGVARKKVTLQQKKSIGKVAIVDDFKTIPTKLISDSNLGAVLISKKTHKVCENAFDGCTNLGKILYDGTEQEWLKINKNNNELKNMQIYYYSQNYPYNRVRHGKYWHYDKNGDILIWTKR